MRLQGAEGLTGVRRTGECADLDVRVAEEQAQQLENAEVLAEINRLAAEELTKVEEALFRIEQAMNALKKG